MFFIFALLIFSNVSENRRCTWNSKATFINYKKPSLYSKSCCLYKFPLFDFAYFLPFYRSQKWKFKTIELPQTCGVALHKYKWNNIFLFRSHTNHWKFTLITCSFVNVISCPSFSPIQSYHSVSSADIFNSFCSHLTSISFDVHSINENARASCICEVYRMPLKWWQVFSSLKQP